MMDPDDFQIFISKKETNRTGKLNEIKLMNTVKRVIYCRSRTRILCSRQRQKLDSFTNIWITKAAEQQLLLLRSWRARWWQREETVEFVLSLPFSEWSSNPMHDALVTSIIKSKFSIVSNVYIGVKSNLRNMYSTLVCSVFLNFYQQSLILCQSLKLLMISRFIVMIFAAIFNNGFYH